LSSRAAFRNLEQFLSRYRDDPTAALLAAEFRALSLSSLGRQSPESIQIARDLYEHALLLVERDAAVRDFDDVLLELQRGLYGELEEILVSGSPPRHHFVIVVPVADRPFMLGNFLESLINQCRIFCYGGDQGGLGKIGVFIIDDSGDPSNTTRIREIATETAATGLAVRYVGRTEQAAVLKKVPAEARKRLSGLTGNFDGEKAGHRGASATRNISYLYIRSQLAGLPEKTLFWFIDSDEEFRVKVKAGEEVRDIPFINYFYWLDRIFTSSSPEVFTGKVVGDPPVTPAVMINTFLDDVGLFLRSLSTARPDDTCIFHSDRSSAPFSADYHDMTGLFGYRKQTSPREYRCGLTGAHTIGDCFDDFAGRARGFFSGLHATRSQYYIHDRHFLETAQARTVYTGNFVITRDGLRHFHPFADLGLRMAGPTLGRILKKRLGERFVSANLPLLHKRTLAENYTDEFRTGIHKGEDSLDLSGEFVRQFWGDVMLFSVVDLVEKGYPEIIDGGEAASTVGKVQAKIWHLYEIHQAEVAEKISAIKRLIAEKGRWWNLQPDAKGSARNLLDFCRTAERNFGPDSVSLKKISRQREEGSMARKIADAILSFQEEDRLWGKVLKGMTPDH
jgi:hypothetical protein